ncbi:MAG: hypothetical protein JSS89_04720 [Bacteroidetes bacterium]|nr:hypothetical protein [Bacteroidota bacterium]
MRTILLIMASAFLVSCVQTPSAPPDPAAVQPRSGGVYVVCEGLWRQDNSVLSYVDPTQMIAVRDVLQANDPLQRLGDTAGDVAVRGDTMFIAVSTSHSIEVVRMSTGTWIGRISLPATQQPRSVVIANDSVGYCTNENDDSITEFDPRTLSVTTSGVRVGPAPSGCAVLNGRLFVGISGFGDLRATEPGAGTIAVLSTTDLTSVGTIGGVPNVGTVRADPTRNRVWASYRDLPSKKDSIGGVVCVNARTLAVVARWTFTWITTIDVDQRTGRCYVLHKYGVDVIDDATSAPRRLITHASSSTDQWYTLGYQASTNNVWVGNARNYVIDGEAFAIDATGAVVARAAVGLNPSAFAFIP